VSAANTTHRTTIGELDRLIRDAGFSPARRRQDYSIIPADGPGTSDGISIAATPAGAQHSAATAAA